MVLFHEDGEKEYRVTLEYDTMVTPEETLIDTASVHADIEQPIHSNVSRAVVMLGSILLVVAFISTGNLAVRRHDVFASIADQNAKVNIAVSPPRGLIFDRYGKVLAENIPSLDLLVVADQLPSDPGERAAEIRLAAAAAQLSPDELKHSIDEGITKEAIFYVARDLSKSQVAAIAQQYPKGFAIVPNAIRSYDDGSQFAHVLGYLGKVSREDMTRDPYYTLSDMVGRAGVESQYESVLRGTHGYVFFDRVSRQQGNVEPRPGSDLALYIDQDIQKTLYNVLYGVLRDANLKGAAGVVQDPATGAVLGLVSFPGFDNNIFSDDVSQVEYTRLFENASRPLFNRVVGGLYSPGSTIKPFIGMTALEEAVVTPSDTIRDCVSISVPNPFRPDAPHIFKNWKVDLGLFNLRRAIANSCNIYFFRVGGGLDNFEGLGITRIAKYLKKALADIILGIDLPGETNGFVPTPEWKLEARNENWFQGDTYNVSIGQGDLVVTPLWINSYISAIANGGTLFRPQVVHAITTPDGITETMDREILAELPFREEVIQEMRRDMEETTRSGTARELNDLPVRVAAKTGTAEVNDKKRINALFTAFAPSGNPKIAVTILVESSVANQGFAIRAAHEFLRWYFGRTASPSPTSP
ncbi:MAG: penicillin-binding transpeptidase domain-containing protein [Patescibacteria group bacterium]